MKVVECLIVDPEMQQMTLEIILYGNSSCVAALFNPALAIKNSLFRTATIQRTKTIIQMMPNAQIFFSWIAGTENAADLVSKVFIDPIAAIKSDLFRHGGTFMVTKDYKGEVFMKISEKDGVEWKGISNKITKAEENTKKLKKLLDTSGEDKMGNKEVEHLQPSWA